MKIESSELLTNPLVAAVAGSLVGLRALPGATLPEKLATVGAGFALAAFAGPAVVEHMGIVSPKVGAGVIFVIGAAGLVIFNSFIEGIKRTDLGAWLSSWLPKRGGGQ